ncbi:G-type lectin S-receptor-like serine/threonine-protein kinase At4g27290 [Olea europaea var. sylvestris]|uniref:G-type lectin S-receptor-like serine/threonine-protein kinase At4g27290 n=1 Tax=Olea europaea var. sylvestris TaxID=158386 RepID=UPI000C1CFAF6|nr:G-type lectin S-receptor-like serine/threonine-protein kinase At4g27290 [Olea europaea var. sylvestris]
MAAVFWLLIICSVYVSDNGIECSETLTPYQVFKNGQTLVSANQRFVLGFFSVSSKMDHNHRMWYLGIWYKEIKPLTVVWVGNRMKSLRGSRIRLVLNSVGDLLLRDDGRTVVWVCKVAQPASRPELVLLDSGNLVIKDGDNLSDGEFVWQSFEFPTDTLLPGMKLGWDLKAGLQHVMTSWRSYEDPSNGGFVFSLKSPQSPQLLLEKNDVAVSRWGPWDGHRFSGTDAITDNPVFKSVYQFSSDEVYFTYEMLDDSILLRLVVNPMGTIQFLKWKNNAQAWVPLVTVNKDICDRFGSCGPYGICYAEDPGCRCLKGFVAKSPNDWCGMDCGDGCRRRYALNCSNGDGFVKYERQKLPDNFTVWKNLSPQECEDNCLKECFCMAYTNINIYGNGSECVVWLGDLLDIRYSIHGGDEIYVRMAHGELESIAYAKRKKEATMIASILISAILGLTVWCVVGLYIFNFRVRKRQGKTFMLSHTYIISPSISH